MSKEVKCSALLDSSFLIRLMNSNDPLHDNAYGYYKYLIENGVVCKISTIAIAEFCVRGEVQDLPLQNLQIVPFNVDHAIEAGMLCKIVFEEKARRGAQITPRAVVPNDTKMFAQASIIEDVRYFLSSDSEAKKIYDILNTKVKFQYVDIHTPYTQTFGVMF